jgi:hypothetical protein
MEESVPLSSAWFHVVLCDDVFNTWKNIVELTNKVGSGEVNV